MAKSSAGPGEIEVYRSLSGEEIGVIAATWHLKPTTSFDDLHLEFDRDPVAAWLNYGSQIDPGAGKAEKDSGIFARNANRNRVHPWNESTRSFASWFRGDPHANYFVHLDLAKNHCAAGVAVTHRDRKSGRVTVDFMADVHGADGRDIQIKELRETFVYGLTERGFHIQLVTLDQWNSLETQQVLVTRGYGVDTESADKTMEPYDTLFDLIRSAMLDYYLHPTFIREMEQLEKVGGKYDHPKRGSKDVADAVACASYRAVLWHMENPHAGDASLYVHRRAVAPLYSRPGWN